MQLPSLHPWCVLLLAAGCLTIAANSEAAEKPESATEQPVLETKSGMAVFYDRSLNGTKTSDGGRLDNSKFTAAHATYPFGTLLRVTRVKNVKTVEVRVTDHLPTTKTNRKLGIIIDFTRAAASKLDMLKDGRAKVTVEVLEWGKQKQK